jgi:hypothetical protein
MTYELESIAADLASLLPLFKDGGSMVGLFLPSQHSARFKELAIEAKSIIDEELGPANEFGLNLIFTVNSKSGGVAGGPSYSAVEETAGIIRAAARGIARKRAKSPGFTYSSKSYVDPSRIAALQSLQGGKWDLTRLIELCREINVAAANRCHLSTAMLLRTILNHVPPTLGFSTFAEIANNYGGPKNKSFKGTMEKLQGSLRNIADLHLHSPIRAIEDLPTSVQVDFSAELDVLLGEIIRVTKTVDK